MPWKIDRLSFLTVDRDLIEAEPEDFDIKRSGADGTAFQLDAYRAPTRQQPITTTVVSSSEADSFRARCKQLETATVAIVDQHGWPWTVYVHSCRVTPRYQIDGRCHLTVRWTVTPKSERP